MSADSDARDQASRHEIEVAIMGADGGESLRRLMLTDPLVAALVEIGRQLERQAVLDRPELDDYEWSILQRGLNRIEGGNDVLDRS